MQYAYKQTHARTLRRREHTQSYFIDLFITFFCTITIMLMVHMGHVSLEKFYTSPSHEEEEKECVDTILDFT